MQSVRFRVCTVPLYSLELENRTCEARDLSSCNLSGACKP